MNEREAHRSFNVQIDKVGTGRNRAFAPDAVDTFLTKGQDVFVDAALDSQGVGPEQTMRQRDLIDSLTHWGVWTQALGQLIPDPLGVYGDLGDFDPPVRNVLPNGYAKAEGCANVLRGEFVTSEEVGRASENAFRRTDTRYSRALMSRFGNKVRVVNTNPAITITEIGVKYLRTLPPVYLGTYNRSDGTIGPAVGFTVGEQWHHYVVTVAVLIAATSIGDEASAAASRIAMQMGFSERVIQRAQRRR